MKRTPFNITTFRNFMITKMNYKVSTANIYIKRLFDVLHGDLSEFIGRSKSYYRQLKSALLLFKATQKTTENITSYKLLNTYIAITENNVVERFEYFGELKQFLKLFKKVKIGGFLNRLFKL